MAGPLLKDYEARYGGAILPVDSEPSAIWQCLQGEDNEILRLLITASGGPFRTTPWRKWKASHPEQALQHPTWRMGQKITIDSATLMNKAFEVIESHWLFGVPWERIEVVVHPQSTIHSMVEFADGSVKAQMGPPDMRLPIQYALFYPQRLPNSMIPRLDTTISQSSTFDPLEPERYPCFSLAIEAGPEGRHLPCRPQRRRRGGGAGVPRREDQLRRHPPTGGADSCGTRPAARGGRGRSPGSRLPGPPPGPWNWPGDSRFPSPNGGGLGWGRSPCRQKPLIKRDLTLTPALSLAGRGGNDGGAWRQSSRR